MDQQPTDSVYVLSGRLKDKSFFTCAAAGDVVVVDDDDGAPIVLVGLMLHGFGPSTITYY